MYKYIKSSKPRIPEGSYVTTMNDETILIALSKFAERHLNAIWYALVHKNTRRPFKRNNTRLRYEYVHTYMYLTTQYIVRRRVLVFYQFADSNMREFCKVVRFKGHWVDRRERRDLLDFNAIGLPCNNNLTDTHC